MTPDPWSGGSRRSVGHVRWRRSVCSRNANQSARHNFIGLHLTDEEMTARESAELANLNSSGFGSTGALSSSGLLSAAAHLAASFGYLSALTLVSQCLTSFA